MWYNNLCSGSHATLAMSYKREGRESTCPRNALGKMLGKMNHRKARRNARRLVMTFLQIHGKGNITKGPAKSVKRRKVLVSENIKQMTAPLVPPRGCSLCSDFGTVFPMWPGFISNTENWIGCVDGSRNTDARISPWRARGYIGCLSMSE